MWDAPAFHHGPRPFMALRQARSAPGPGAQSLRSRVRGRFHCRHSRQRSRRRIQPSSSSKTALVLRQPEVNDPAAQQRVQSSRWYGPAIVRVPAASDRARESSAAARSQAPSAAEVSCACVTLYPRNLRSHGRATALFCALMRRCKTSSRKTLIPLHHPLARPRLPT